MQRGIDGRMYTKEEHAKAFFSGGQVVFGSAAELGHFSTDVASFAPMQIANAAPRHYKEPGFGIVGPSLQRPGLKRALKRIGKRILGCRPVACPGGQEGKEPPVRITGDSLENRKFSSHYALR